MQHMKPSLSGVIHQFHDLLADLKIAIDDCGPETKQLGLKLLVDVMRQLRAIEESCPTRTGAMA